jgi:hypothetical protein
MLIPRSLRPRFGTLLAKKGWYFFASFVFCDLGFFSSYLFFLWSGYVACFVFFFFFFFCFFCFFFVVSWFGFFFLLRVFFFFFFFFKLLSFSFCDFLDGFLLFHVCFWVNSLFCAPGLG